MTAQTIADIARRFATEGANHRMEIARDDGFYRHLRFRHQEWLPPLAEPQDSRTFWFDLITVPGALIFQGDGQSFVFSRLPDMFEFFRGKPSIDPHYWGEKLTSCTREDVKSYDVDLFKQLVAEHVTEAIECDDAPEGLVEAVRAQVLNDSNIYYEAGALEALECFQYGVFSFSDVWEWEFGSYNWWFLWVCHAIVWGIALYDAEKAGRDRPVFPVPPAQPPAPAGDLETVGARASRPVHTVCLPGDGA